jgi:hypothetical protein
MTAVQTFREGARRVAGAPAVLVGAFVLNLLIAAPLALVLRATIADHFGSSQMADQAAQGFSTDWWSEFHDRQDGHGPALGSTLTPAVIGFAAVLRHLSDLLDARPPDASVVGAIALWLLLWTFLAGGVIARYAHGAALHAEGFFGACGHHVFRLLRLAAIAGLAYLILFRIVHPFLFGTVYGRLTHDLAVERTAFLIRLALYVVFGLLLATVHIVTDAARLRAVVEDRRSMIGAYLAGRRLIAHRWRTVLGLYALTGTALGLLWLLYALLATGGRGGGIWVWLALATGQIYLIARLWLKLQVLASLVALYQADLGYRSDSHLDATRGGEDPDADGDVPIWPESPAADRLGVDA